MATAVQPTAGPRNPYSASGTPTQPLGGKPSSRSPRTQTPPKVPIHSPAIALPAVQEMKYPSIHPANSGEHHPPPGACLGSANTAISTPPSLPHRTPTLSKQTVQQGSWEHREGPCSTCQSGGLLGETNAQPGPEGISQMMEGGEGRGDNLCKDEQVRESKEHLGLYGRTSDSGGEGGLKRRMSSG